MDITLVPTLDVLRELYSRPRDFERFQWYLQQVTGTNGAGKTDIVLPIANVNPMGKEHCLRAVEALIELGAEHAIVAAMVDFGLEAYLDSDANVALNLIDDLEGGWTNRYLVEAGLRFSSPDAERANRRRRFVIVPCWTSVTYTRDVIYQETLAALYRLAWRDNHGLPKTLDALLQQEGNAMRFAAVRPAIDGPYLLAPSLTDADLACATAVIQDHLDATDFPTHFAAFFGDEAAAATGYPRLGLPHRAGFAVALAEAHRSGFIPDQALITEVRTIA